MSAKHTPPPWRLADPKEYPWILAPADYRGEDTFTVICDHPSARGYGVISAPISITDRNAANFEFIVCAVNSHEALVEALRLVITPFAHVSDEAIVGAAACGSIIHALRGYPPAHVLSMRAALRLAEGG